MREPGLITKYLVEKAQGIIKLEPEISDNEGIGYLAFDSGGVEIEVGEFLYGLVRALKPQRVLTTGVYSGISDAYIALGLKDNGFGQSQAVEYETFHIERARNLWETLGIANIIHVHQGSSLDFVPSGLYQLIFLDTEPMIRFAELEKFFPKLEPGGFIGIHDLPRTFCQGNINQDHPEMKSYPFGDVPPQMQEWLQTGKLVKFHLPSPRGMVFFYKTREEDYNVKT